MMVSIIACSRASAASTRSSIWAKSQESPIRPGSKTNIPRIVGSFFEKFCMFGPLLDIRDVTVPTV